MRQLGLAAKDRTIPAIKEDDTNVRSLIQLLAVPRRTISQAHDGASYAAPSPIRGRREVHIMDAPWIDVSKAAAEQYVLNTDGLATLCQQNAEISRELLRHDHARVFATLQNLFPPDSQNRHTDSGAISWQMNSFARMIIERL